MNKYIFWGPLNGFEEEYKLSGQFSFSELVRKVQKEEKTIEIDGVSPKTSNDIGKIENLVILSDEYSMVNEWVLYNIEAFLNRFDIENVYLQNPPIQVYNRLIKTENCLEKYMNIKRLMRNVLKKLMRNFQKYNWSRMCKRGTYKFTIFCNI